LGSKMSNRLKMTSETGKIPLPMMLIY